MAVAIRGGGRVIKRNVSQCAAKENRLRLGVTRQKLESLQKTTRNVDGSVYVLNIENEEVIVRDRKGKRFPVYEEGSIITIDPTMGDDAEMNSLTSLAGMSRSSEVLNSRVAMLGFVAAMGLELVGGEPFQAGGLPLFLFITASATASTLAPLLWGRADYDTFIPREDDPYPNSTLPRFWTATAEITNGRAAMIGMAGLAVQEAIQKSSLF